MARHGHGMGTACYVLIGLNRTAAVICDWARVSSCYVGCVLADPGRNATDSLVFKSVGREDRVIQHSTRPLAVRHGAWLWIKVMRFRK